MESNFDWTTEIIQFCVKPKYFTWFLIIFAQNWEMNSWDVLFILACQKTQF